METLSEPLLEKQAVSEESTAVNNDGGDALLAEEEGQPNGIEPDDAQELGLESSPGSAPVHGLLRKVVDTILRILFTPLIPESGADHTLKVQIRFLKFLGLTFFGIGFTRLVVFSLDWEHRQGLTVYDTWLYDGNSILLDCVVLFSVGRLHTQRLPLDHLAWVIVMLVSALYTSVLPNFKFLQHSVTLYEMHCTWPWQLWVFFFVLMVPVCGSMIILHLRHARRQGDLQRKGVEMIGSFLLFLVPQMAKPNFEFHHWFAGLLCGMHANYDVAFSRLTMAWCWGQYINGIAVWGRDPVMTCAYAYYIGTRQHCHNDAVGNDECWANLNLSSMQWDATSQPDWRHCKSG